MGIGESMWISIVDEYDQSIKERGTKVPRSSFARPPPLTPHHPPPALRPRPPSPPAPCSSSPPAPMRQHAPPLSSRPSEASGGILYRAESRVEHGSIHAFPFKKGEGMRKGRMFFIDTQTRKISPLGQSRLLLPLGRNDKKYPSPCHLGNLENFFRRLERNCEDKIIA